VIEDVFLDHNGVFVAFIDDQPVGFCQCTDEYAEENKGYVSILGVALEYQGLGIGEALLQTGISHSATKGYSALELNVDTGNETGALKLYEKVGLKPESSWIQLHRPQS
jgi:ribosomal protein S18 acetylase RimI-like enzyme